MTMDDILLDGKTVLVRVDFNVSVGADGVVDAFEDYRIQAALPTLEELLQRRCKVILLTHLGRPDEGNSEFDLEPVRRRLSDLLHDEVRLLKRLYGAEVTAAISAMEAGTAILLPNVRWDEREEAGSEKLAQELANLAEVYINEAFSVAHRAHTSVALVPRLLPAAAGRRLVEEYTVLTELSARPAKPYVAIVSGAKVKTKIRLLEKLLAEVDHLCLGGVLANAFLVALRKCSAEQCAAEDLAAAEELWEKYSDKIELPEDVVVGPQSGAVGAVTVLSNKIPADVGGVWDVGPYTVKRYLDLCQSAGTILWNGPLGKVEEEAYRSGTSGLAIGLAALPGFRVVGGGDTVNILERLKLVKRFDHVSVGGGAMVALLEDSTLPGLTPLYAQD